MRWGEAGPPFPARLPAAVQKDLAGPGAAREQVGARKIHAHHFIRGNGMGHAHMRDVVQGKRGTFLSRDPDFAGVCAHDVRLG